MSKFHFGASSQARMMTLHPKLQEVLDRAMLETEEDFCIVSGHRGIESQNQAYYSGNSGARFGESNHNYYPSMAVDLAPYPIDWMDQNAFERLAKLILKVADDVGVRIVWGISYRREGREYKDLPHFELDPKSV